MQINVSGLLRDFARVRRAALAGKRIVVATRDGNLVLTAESRTPGPAGASSDGERLSSASPDAGGRRFVGRNALAEAARSAPRIDAQRFRDDLDALIDPDVDG